MSDFSKFNLAVQRQFAEMKKHKLFRVNLDKDKLWAKYLASFPPGTDPKRKERTEHDCQCCKSFIRSVGDTVAIVNNQVVSLWDVDVADPTYKVVAAAMSAFVKEHAIDDVFLHFETGVGVAKNFGTDKLTGAVTQYYHFNVQLPTNLVVKGADIGTKLSLARANKDVFLRSLTELKMEALDTVLELVAQNSLYRGEEHKFAVAEFKKLKVAFDRLKTDQDKSVFCWSRVDDTPVSVLKIRNTAIGTLLINLSEGMDIDRAVTAFEKVVAPTNYKRPTALVTKAMVEQARKKIDELGLTASLDRRFATLKDVSVSNILFVDRSVRKDLKGDVFGEIASKLGDKSKKLDKIEEVSVDKFVSDILPRAETIEVMLENRHRNNLVSLVAPCDPTAKGMFKWGNPFSWSYAGDLADSIKERVKAAGGRVDADFRCSLSWFNLDDLDLHLVLPNGSTIYYGHKHDHGSLGQLDVDMNAGIGKTRNAVENIFFADRKRMPEGRYKLEVHNFARRETIDVGFNAEIEFDGQTTSFSYDKALPDKRKVVVADFTFSRKDGITFHSALPSDQRVETIWNIPTQSFHRVNLLMLSPNHWDGRGVGNKHHFFFLDKCLNDGSSRGFFNEFLSAELDQHRKVLEIVGSKMKTEASEEQLSGLGFSSTKRDSLVVRVSGSFTRTVKVLF